MQAATSISERIARTRSRQAQALGLAGQEPARRQRDHVGVVETGRAAANDAAPAALNPYCVNLKREFEALLPAATHLYGYGQEDIAHLRQGLCGERAGVQRELELVVRQWRVDVVTAGLDVRGGVVPDGVARRARIQFRVTVMGESRDENGSPYAQDALDWEPEPTAQPDLAEGAAPTVGTRAPSAAAVEASVPSSEIAKVSARAKLLGKRRQ